MKCMTKNLVKDKLVIVDDEMPAASIVFDPDNDRDFLAAIQLVTAMWREREERGIEGDVYLADIVYTTRGACSKKVA